MIFILGSARGSRADFGGLAEILGTPYLIYSGQKFRDGEAAIARTRAACAPQNEQSHQVLSLRCLSDDHVVACSKRKLNFLNFRVGNLAVAFESLCL
jgi:hypothetical protein